MPMKEPTISETKQPDACAPSGKAETVSDAEMNKKIDTAARRILNRYRHAFEVLAK